MNEAQRTQAVALLAIPEIREVAEGFRTTRLYLCVEWWEGRKKFCAPNLADKIGAVEGWLHRVLERLVGEDVEVYRVSRGMWRFRGCVCLPPTRTCHPTRFEAIVSALLELCQ